MGGGSGRAQDSCRIRINGKPFVVCLVRGGRGWCYSTYLAFFLLVFVFYFSVVFRSFVTVFYDTVAFYFSPEFWFW